ncbi:hypothetical protein EE612_025748 [Oryza sativa]|nr:hypothetical protein EE612_025748 [Oryza sativa]
MSVPFGDRRTKFPVSSSTAEAPVTLILVVQRMWPWESDSTMPELLVMARVADEGVVIGLSRLATHTTVRWGMLWNQTPT